MKRNGGIFLLRIEFERERHLTDSEWRLWLVYRSLCVWDDRKTDYGTITATIKDIQRFLDWSAGSIWATQKSLVKKGKLEYVGRSKYRLCDASKLLRPNFRSAEMAIQGIENAVQYVENRHTASRFSVNQKSYGKRGFSDPHFQRAEFGSSLKETIKKDKEKQIFFEKKEGEIPNPRDA